MTSVISVEHLSKIYHLGQIGTGTFTNDLRVWWAKARGKPNPLLRIGQSEGQADELWALRDLTFTVEQGEVLGIIGRNGAGKSTLLKILSRVTAPSSGRIRVRGRIASLLEVGTGFHPDLTGRENIFLNGAILGMTHTEIARKFDEIVDFSEVEKFIDTPVKRYSSGMYVRLAFAVAAHLEPEILVVDEVLAVGDAEFQKKCLGKMGDVAHAGRTVLFVSHNMGSIGSLCDRALLFEKGQILIDDTVQETIRGYLGFTIPKSSSWTAGELLNNPTMYFREIFIKNGQNNLAAEIDFVEEFSINLITVNKVDLPNCEIHIRIVNDEGIPVFTTSSADENLEWQIKKGEYLYQAKIPGKFLKPGRYSVVVAAMIPNQELFDLQDSVISFTIHDTGINEMSRYPRLGIINPMIRWNVYDRS